MITRFDDWKHALASAVRDPAQLLELLDLPPSLLPAALTAGAGFPLRVPHAYIACMAKGDAADPLLRQVLPLAAELATVPGFSTDPVGDLAAGRGPGLLHKYHGRLLLVTTGACAIHCRYCFRRHFPYAEENAAAADWEASIATVAADPTLQEVVLSGGDPLVLSDDKLARLAGRLAAIPHLQRLRIHTRLPVVLPERVTPELLRWLTGSRLLPVVVVHANHANELSAPVVAALLQLRQAGVTLLNQAVLLRGVNDQLESQLALNRRLFEAGVLPYYLHLLDRVAGAAHFEVTEGEAQSLLAGLRRELPGYLVPRLVREVRGAPFKLPLAEGGWQSG